jgi:putative tributyrin esterase
MALFQSEFFSCVLKRSVEVTVFLPEVDSGMVFFRNLDVEKAHPRRSYRTIYLLHGMMDSRSSWLCHTNVTDYAQKHRYALVLPSGENSWYSNTTDYGPRYFDFINYELPTWAESAFPLCPGRENRTIAGLSMGGYGAAKGALSAPEQYALCGIFSGVTDIVGMSRDNAAEHEANPNAPTDMVRFAFGRGIESGDDADLFALAQKLSVTRGAKPDFFIGCGTEDTLYAPLCRFRSSLQKNGFSVAAYDIPGRHEWAVWDQLIQRFMEYWSQNS